MAMAGVMIMMPFYLELIRNIPTDHAGVILLTMPVGMILSAWISAPEDCPMLSVQRSPLRFLDLRCRHAAVS